MAQPSLELEESIFLNGAHDDMEPPEPPESDYKPDEDIIALELREKMKNKVAYFRNSWQVYDQGVWTTRHTAEIKRSVRKYLRDYRKRGIAVSQRLISSLTSLLEDDCFIADRNLIDDSAEARKYINLQNGLYNLETHQLEAHRPELYFTTQLSFKYDPDADWGALRRYLNSSLVHPITGDKVETDYEMVSLVQEALAYSMTARTDLKASFWLVGKPDSGKSTMVGFIRSLMGSLHSTIDLNQLAQNRFLLSGIVGKRVVTFTEVATNSVLPDALYKAMVGGQDEIYADVKGKPGIAFVPEAKFWWAMNEAPRVTDRSGATLNRLKPIIFNRSIPQDQRNPNLERELRAERAGAFNWLMFGMKRLQYAGKFTEPKQSLDWIRAYQLENDTEQTFLNEKCKRAPNGIVQSEQLYDAYRAWCEQYGFKCKNLNQIAKEWERLGLVRTRKNDANYWEGITLNS